MNKKCIPMFDTIMYSKRILFNSNTSVFYSKVTHLYPRLVSTTPNKPKAKWTGHSNDYIKPA